MKWSAAALALLLGIPSIALGADELGSADHRPPMAVIAHIDSGINPYHEAFRDSSPRAFIHPCLYLPGYPCSTPALVLDFDAPDLATALAQDVAIWGDADTPSSIVTNQLYWIPGTRIVGALRFHFGGGTSCSLSQAPPLSYVGDPTQNCIDHPIIDDHGHGTMTASRMAGRGTSLCPQCLIVSVEGLTGDAVRWVADQGWIDVQTNSWVDLVPPPANHLLQPMWDASPELRDLINGGNSTTVQARDAAARMPVFFASGNGAAYILGFAPTPTYALSTAPPGVILVGGHDNGQVTTWPGAPAHVAADAYGGLTAIAASIDEVRGDPVACCTSASSPYAAGGAGALILRARGILGSHGTGVHDGVIARAPRDHDNPDRGPLRDGVFTLEEFKSVYLRTADPRPRAGPHDGMLQWVGSPEEGVPLDLVTTYGVGGNPFCAGCVTTPVAWADVPREVNQFPLLGYGAVNGRSLGLATQVLLGQERLPDREREDRLYRVDQLVREVEFLAS